jgi:hypothetical protein
MVEQLDTNAIISGPITPDEASVLSHEAPNSPATTEVLNKIGAVAHENGVALVVATDETGQEQPSHFVALRPDDMGTEIEPAIAQDHSPVDQLKLPSPEAAHAHLIAQAEQVPKQQ